jgi:hypothetical protein
MRSVISSSRATQPARAAAARSAAEKILIILSEAKDPFISGHPYHGFFACGSA